MNVLLLNPYHTGSHAQWAEGIARHVPRTSDISIQLETLPGRHWKWRLHGASGTFAHRIHSYHGMPDCLLTTDMLDVAALRGLLPASWREIPIVQYFHENQLTFPWSERDREKQHGHDRSYGFMNIQSAIAADAVWFNSTFHQRAFLAAIDAFIAELPDETEAFKAQRITSKSKVIPLGIDKTNAPVSRISVNEGEAPVILWNHRWEYDKGPVEFYEALCTLDRAGESFQLILCGEQFREHPEVFNRILTQFKSKIIHVGFAATREAYDQLLQRSTFIVHAPLQEYFGLSVAEAMAHGVIPLLQRGQAYESWIPSEYVFESEDDFLIKWRALKQQIAHHRMAAHAIASNYFWPEVSEVIAKALKDIAGLTSSS